MQRKPEKKSKLKNPFSSSLREVRSDLGHIENWTKLFQCPTSSEASEGASKQKSVRSRASGQSEQCGASERASE